jgi:hypothetical protein
MYPPANFWRLDGWHGCPDVRKKPSTVLAEGSLSSISAMEVFDFLCRFVRFHNPLDISIGDIGAILSKEAKHLCLAPIELGEQRSQTFETQPIFLFHFLRPPFGHLYITIYNLYVNNNLNILVAGGWLSYATSSTAPIRRRLLEKKAPSLSAKRPSFVEFLFRHIFSNELLYMAVPSAGELFAIFNDIAVFRPAQGNGEYRMFRIVGFFVPKLVSLVMLIGESAFCFHCCFPPNGHIITTLYYIVK